MPIWRVETHTPSIFRAWHFPRRHILTPKTCICRPDGVDRRQQAPSPGAVRGPSTREREQRAVKFTSEPAAALKLIDTEKRLGNKKRLGWRQWRPLLQVTSDWTPRSDVLFFLTKNIRLDKSLQRTGGDPAVPFVFVSSFDPRGEAVAHAWRPCPTAHRRAG